MIRDITAFVKSSNKNTSISSLSPISISINLRLIKDKLLLGL